MLFLTRTLLLSLMTPLFVAAAAAEEKDPLPVNLSCDDLRWTAEGEAQCEGNVRLEQGPIRLEADSMTVTWEDRELVKVAALGSPATFVREADEQSGTPEATASAQRIVYLHRESRVEFQDGAILKQAERTISGSLITLDLATRELTVDSGPESQAEIIYTPKPD